MKTGEILHLLREHKPGLAARFGVRRLDLFGSCARGEQSVGSDVDILVEFDEVPSLLRLVRLENHLTDLLGVKVDLVLKDGLKPRISQRVAEEAVPV